jgi:two-component SAPR family response regulator
MTDRLEELYHEMLDITAHMVEEYGGMEVAAIMMAQAMSIYKTGLSEMDYNQMVDSISASRTKVQKFTPNILQ